MVSTIPSLNSVNNSQLRLDIRNLQPQLIEWRRHLHQYPELGFKETLTAEFVAEKLKKWGIEHETGIAKTGIVAIIDSGKPGPVLAIRADLDALPIQEENDVSYKSQHQGIMHACGHDGHTAIALGTAYYLAHHRHSFQGLVKIIFQPAEEGPGGAKPMIEAGVLKNPNVDALIGLHLWNNLPLGTIGVRSGGLMAAVEKFQCTIYGKGGHGAIPHQTIDSIVVASHIVLALQTIVSRNVNPLDAAVVSVGSLHAGNTDNVIADSAKMLGTVRYFNPSYKGFFGSRVEQIIAGICQSQGASYELNYASLYPPVINDKRITELVQSVAETLVETPAGVVPECQTMAAEDIAYFLQEVPGCYFFLGSANVDKNLDFPHHHPRFDFDETVLAMGVEMFVRCVEKFCVGNHLTVNS
ncbi:putative amidohydrolase YhaA [Planktothrix agardhii]|uniref:M20 family metallopeptidase n=1 Tax=Planktothrix agardhii TaxID=1160 RepID=UPI00040EDBE0|nr:M20 family metallopeptidase [Planktothrix agardhii]CAD0231995.1 putative amidohydrolase YhaA [Planktothrix agardhii]